VLESTCRLTVSERYESPTYCSTSACTKLTRKLDSNSNCLKYSPRHKVCVSICTSMIMCSSRKIITGSYKFKFSLGPFPTCLLFMIVDFTFSSITYSTTRPILDHQHSITGVQIYGYVFHCTSSVVFKPSEAYRHSAVDWLVLLVVVSGSEGMNDLFSNTK
jgi:hypothetical protein